MPREKVRPEDRQRSLKACTPCKQAKIRCDSKLPCVSCVSRHRSSACRYDAPSKRARYPSARHASSPGVATETFTSAGVAKQRLAPSATLMPDIAAVISTGDAPVPAAPATVTPSASASERLSQPDQGPLRPLAHETPAVGGHGMLSPCSLSASNGNDIQFGASSSMSFLRLLRTTMRQFSGPSEFTDGAVENHNSSAAAQTHGHGSRPISQPDRLARQELIEAYFEATGGVFLLFEHGELDHFESQDLSCDDAFDGDAVQSTDLASFYMALAIGGQYKGANYTHARFSADCFDRARKMAFGDMLSNPGLGTIRLFALLSFYMLAAFQRKQAYVYLGVALKISNVLGLHLSLSDYTQRSRIWTSLQNVDMILNSLLGTPGDSPASANGSIESPYSTATSANQPYEHEAHAIAALGKIVNRIMLTLAQSNKLEVSAAERSLEQLREWRLSSASGVQSLPSLAANQQPLHSSNPPTAQLHRVCLYYFAVIVVTRPFLIANSLERLSAKPCSNRETARNANTDPKVSKLAQACISSARFLIETCWKHMGPESTFVNSAILLPWIFISGLVLGLATFAGGGDDDIGNGSREALKLLEQLQVATPQAAHLVLALRNFGEAIVQTRELESRKRSLLVREYVEKIPVFGVDSDQGTDDTGQQDWHSTAVTSQPNSNGGTGDVLDNAFQSQDLMDELGLTSQESQLPFESNLAWDQLEWEAGCGFTVFDMDLDGFN